MGRRRWEQVLFTFMGPPQLGDLSAPDTSTPDPAAATCPTCAHPWDAHGRVRSARGTRLTCPEPAGPRTT